MKPQERRWRQMNRYKEARLHAGLSQKAAAISLGVRPPSMSDWESGKTKPTHEHLVAMAALYGTTTDYLTGASDTKEKQPTAQSSELVENIISRIRDLDDPVLYRVSDFLAGIRAGQETVLAESARQDSDDEPAV
jgi:transcriptional regulator with XRE-family HTH domain